MLYYSPRAARCYYYASRSARASSFLWNEENALPGRSWLLRGSNGRSITVRAAAAAGVVCVTATIAAATGKSCYPQQHQQQQQRHVRYFHSSNKTLMEEAARGSPPRKNEDEVSRQNTESAAALDSTKRWREEKDNPDNNAKSSTASFWETLVTDVKEMKKDLHEIMSDVNELMKPDQQKSSQRKEASSSSHSSPSSSSLSSPSVDSLASVGSALMKLLLGGGEGRHDDKVTTAEEIIKRARENAAAKCHDNDVSNSQQDGSTLLSILQILDTYKDKLDQVAGLYMGSIDLAKIPPTALYYYVEHEDEVKNPSWKRRMHRYHPGIDVNQMQEINDACDLALIAYADDEQEIQESLANFKTPYALVYANVISEPGKPASFLAVKRESSSSSPLEVLLCVRGTKTIADAVTDVICNVQPYRGGKAHALILQSGQYLAHKYAPLLQELLNSSSSGGKQSKINLTLIGHSMGAGAATIAGLELNDIDENITVEKVVGFGCPALLSKDLAEKVSPFVSTIINDNDMIPRMSGVSAANLLTKIMHFDWLPFAKRDVRHAVEELHRSQPLLFNQQVCEKILGLVEPFLEQNLQSAATTTTDQTNNDTTKQQQQQLLFLKPELFPPGQCIHFYRDGIGVSVNVVPNTFFGEIDFSRRMLDDHLIYNGYQQIFLDLMRQQKQDHHFKFDDKAERKMDR